MLTWPSRQRRAGGRQSQSSSERPCSSAPWPWWRSSEASSTCATRSSTTSFRAATVSPSSWSGPSMRGAGVGAPRSNWSRTSRPSKSTWHSPGTTGASSRSARRSTPSPPAATCLPTLTDVADHTAISRHGGRQRDRRCQRTGHAGSWEVAIDREGRGACSRSAMALLKHKTVRAVIPDPRRLAVSAWTVPPGSSRTRPKTVFDRQVADGITGCSTWVCRFRVDLSTNCSSAGVLIEVWLEKGASSTNTNQECPPRFPITETRRHSQ